MDIHHLLTPFHLHKYMIQLYYDKLHHLSSHLIFLHTEWKFELGYFLVLKLVKCTLKKATTSFSSSHTCIRELYTNPSGHWISSMLASVEVRFDRGDKVVIGEKAGSKYSWQQAVKGVWKYTLLIFYQYPNVLMIKAS